MTESRNFGSPGSILSDVQRVSRPRVPLRFADQGRPGLQQGASHGQLWGCQGGVWGTCGGAARVGSPREIQPREARPLLLPSAHDLFPGHPPAPCGPPARRAQDLSTPRPRCQSISPKSNDFPSALRAVAHRSRREPGSAGPAGLRRNPVYSGTRCREPPSAAAH
jgi:hypothetical protein